MMKEFDVVDVIIISDDNTCSSCPSWKNKRKRKVTNSLNTLKVKTRKLKQANWENSKIMALTNAWKVEHEANLDVVDSQDNMETLVTKWKQIVKLSWSMVNGQWSFLSITTIVETNGGPYMENTRISMTT